MTTAIGYINVKLDCPSGNTACGGEADCCGGAAATVVAAAAIDVDVVVVGGGAASGGGGAGCGGSGWQWHPWLQCWVGAC